MSKFCICLTVLVALFGGLEAGPPECDGTENIACQGYCLYSLRKPTDYHCDENNNCICADLTSEQATTKILPYVDCSKPNADTTCGLNCMALIDWRAGKCNKQGQCECEKDIYFEDKYRN